MSWDYHQPQQTTATGSTNYLCRSTGTPCPNATEYGYCTQTVCNNCGARWHNPCADCQEFDCYGCEYKKGAEQWLN